MSVTVIILPALQNGTWYRLTPGDLEI